MTIDTKPLSERLRGLAREYRATMDKEVALSWGADAQRELFSIADALDAKDALLREAAEVLAPFSARVEAWAKVGPSPYEQEEYSPALFGAMSRARALLSKL